jgi:hypothetical protein
VAARSRLIFAKLASVYIAQHDKANARETLSAGHEIMIELVRLSPENAHWKGDLADLDRQLTAVAP